MLKMPLVNKNFIKYLKSQIALFKFYYNAIFSNYGKNEKFWYTLFHAPGSLSSRSFRKMLFGQSPFPDWYFKMDDIKNHEFNV